MFQNDLLDVAIGLVFAWFILSVVISVVNDGLALLFRIRAKNLWLGIDRLLNPSTGKYARHFWDAAWFLPLSKWNNKGLDRRPNAKAASADQPSGAIAVNQPVNGPQATTIQAIYDALAPAVTDVATAGRKSKLTTISSTVFAEAVAALAKPVYTADLGTAAEALGWTDEQTAALHTAVDRAPTDIPLSLEQTTSLPVANATSDQLTQLYEKATELVTLRDVVALFTANPGLTRALHKAVATSGIDAKAAAVKSTVQVWFDREMEQASALYRRQNRKILALLALPVVLIFQANTLGIIADLRNDSALRDAVVNQAIVVSDKDSVTGVIADYCPPANGSAATTTAAANTAAPSTPPSDADQQPETTPPAPATTVNPTPSAETIPTGSAGAVPAGAAAGTESTDDGGATTTSVVSNPAQEATEKLECVADIIRAAGKFELVPDIDRIRALDADDSFFFGLSWGDVWHYETNDWGWLGRPITILALMFGAQFWFDVLRRLVGIRKTIGTGGAAAG